VNTKRVVLVTGASSGIGFAAAEQLAREGWTVYAGARRLDRMDSLRKRAVITLALDVTDDASMVAAVARIVDEQGQIDGLVSNAGYGSYGALEDVSMDEARRQIEVNLVGLARVIQLVLPHMRRQGSGRIVNITSIGGKIHEPLGGWYHATKFAVEGLSDCLRMETAPFGIQVVVIEPGGTLTEWGAIAAKNLLAASENSAYQDQAKATAHILESTSNPQSATPPAVVAEVIVKALTTKSPKTRYVVAAGAKPLLFLRRILSDRGFDWVMRVLPRFVR
jgi:NAD(P)-dependent dehydrogenase (short-subunit alcohol dehydrogenase family)